MITKNHVVICVNRLSGKSDFFFFVNVRKFGIYMFQLAVSVSVCHLVGVFSAFLCRSLPYNIDQI